MTKLSLKTWFVGPDEDSVERAIQQEVWKQREEAADELNSAISRLNRAVDAAYAEYRAMHSQIEMEYDCSFPQLPSPSQRPFVSAYARETIWETE